MEQVIHVYHIPVAEVQRMTEKIGSAVAIEVDLARIRASVATIVASSNNPANTEIVRTLGSSSHFKVHVPFCDFFFRFEACHKVCSLKTY